MATIEELEALSSKELHDRAHKRARRHVDVDFYWDLMKYMPAAEVAAGNPDQSTADIFHIGSLIRDFIEEQEGSDHLDALRPFYIEYLVEHDD
jgi:hypothetical protein